MVTLLQTFREIGIENCHCSYGGILIENEDIPGLSIRAHYLVFLNKSMELN